MSIDETFNSGLALRGQALSKDGGFLRSHFTAIWGNSYSSASPSGVINLGTSDNYAMGAEIAKFINEKVQLVDKDVDYGVGPWGSVRLRNAMARFFNTWFSAIRPISPDDIIFASGCTSLCEMLGFTLFEPGDGLLLSKPIYQAFQRDFSLRAEVQPVFVPCHGMDEFEVNRVEQYEVALREAELSGTKIKALLLCNPHNPLGRCYKPEALVEYMKLCKQYGIHLIVDEVYALSIYGSLTGEDVIPFKSVMAIDTDQHIDPTHLHVLYGYSKDFACGGLRLGCLWSRNAHLISALSGLALFNWPSTISDRIAVAFLEDEEWFRGFVKKNQITIRASAEFASKILQEYEIPYLPGAYAGFFLLVDLRGFVHGKDPEEVTPEDERELKAKLFGNGVYITSGKGLACEEPCLFRFCFMRDKDEVREGIKRLYDALTSEKITQN